jgi:hypothetical protein
MNKSLQDKMTKWIEISTKEMDNGIEQIGQRLESLKEEMNHSREDE